MDVEWRAFELHPGIPPEGQLINWPPETLAQRSAAFKERAEAEGLEVGERKHWYDSRPAHEAALWAAAQGKGDGFRKALYRAYFVEDRNIGSADVLAELASDLGLDAADLRKALEEGRYRQDVEAQFDEARQIDGKALEGAYPYEIFEKLMAMTGTPKRTTRAP